MSRRIRTAVGLVALSGAMLTVPLAIATPASAAATACQARLTGTTSGKALCLVTGSTKYWVKLTCAKITTGVQRTVTGPHFGAGGDWSTAHCLTGEEAVKAQAEHS